MGKFIYAIITAFLIELSLWLFAGTDYANSALFGLLTDPSNLTTTAIYILLYGTLAVFGASAVIPGNFIQINIYALYAGIAVILITFTLPIVHLFQFVFGELQGIFPLDTVLAQAITILIVSPFIIMFMMGLTEWVRSNT